MQSTPFISVQNVRKSFRDVKAVNGINLDIFKGEYIALLGPNGAGKTTLMEMIEGIQAPDEGNIQIKGMSWKSHQQELHRILGISLQETYFFERLKVMETLNLFGSFYSLGSDRSEEILKTVGLGEKKKAYVKNLSGGQRQRLTLGISLINKPEILLLDEPTTGLDPAARRELWDILFKLRKENNLTLILTTHYMEEADYLCERIVIMDKGNILAQGTVNELLSQYKLTEIVLFSLENDSDKLVPVFKTMMKEELVRDEKNNSWKIQVEDIIRFLPSFLENMKQKGYIIKTLECRKMTLDDVFLSMTGRGLND